MKHWTLTIVAAVSSLLTSCASKPTPAEGLAQVKAGTHDEAYASWWGFNPEDATQCLQNAIDSGARKLIVDNVGADWVVGPIKPASDQEIVFEDGVVVRAKKDAFKKRGDCLFEMVDRENITIRGQGTVTWIMNKTDYQDPKRYEPAEHRHILRIYGCRNVDVHNLTLKSSGGDGVYVGSPRDVESSDIFLERLICLDHHRQGISVTGRVKRLHMKDCKFNDTKGTAPQCGLDYEPNYPTGTLIDCLIENCDFDGNALAGICVSCHKLDATSTPMSITFKGCRVRGNDVGVLIVSTGQATASAPGKIEFIDCEIADSAHGSIAITEHRVGNLAIEFKDCVIDNRKSSLPAFRISSNYPEDLFGVKVDGLTVIDDQDRPPIQFFSHYGNAMVEALVQDVVVDDGEGNKTDFDGAKFLKDSAPSPEARNFKTVAVNPKDLKPLNAKGVDAGAGIQYRGAFDYLLYAKPGDKIKLKLTNHPVHAFYKTPLQVEVSSPTLVLVDRIEIPYGESVEYTLNAAEHGVYRLAADAKMQTISVETSAPGGVLAGETLKIFGCQGRLYFHVPEGVEDILIETAGSPREESSVYLLNPKGDVVDSGVNLSGGKVLKFKRSKNAKTEIWSLRFNASKLFVRVGAPLIPLLSAAPENVLVEK